MFDDQNQNQPNPQVPNNLPFGQPQSPFASGQPESQLPSQQAYAQPAPQQQPMQQPYSQPAQQPIPQAMSSSSAPIEDMFSGADQASSSRPVSATPQQAPIYPYQQQSPQAGYYQASGQMGEDVFGRRGIPWGKIVTFAIIGIVIAGGIGATYFGYQFISGYDFNSGRTADVIPQDANNQPVSENAVSGENETTGNNGTEIATAIIEETEEIIDSDGDGLTDSEEKALGTKIDMADTDNDGLTDWAEIRIYKTDPLNADTDGDGYKDGQEVVNGYDPAKPGSARLYEVPENNVSQ